MNGFMKSTLAMMFVAGGLGSIGCNGGERYRDLVDPCPMERYSAEARQEVITAFTPQVQNGRILDQTIWNYHFEPGTDKLNPSGLDKLDQIVRRRPEPDNRVFLATARDLTFNPEKSNDFADARRELDAKRSVAVQKYLTAQTAGRPMTFDLFVHDPAESGISGTAAQRMITSQRGNYTGTLGSVGGGGGGAAAQSGGAQQGGAAPQGGATGTAQPPRQRQSVRLRKPPVSGQQSGLPPGLAGGSPALTRVSDTMTRFPLLAAILAVVLLASPASAAQPLDLARYWSGLRGFWAGIFGSVSGVVGVVLVTGAISLFIITRGKWLK
jgi:hypothetical protein